MNYIAMFLLGYATADLLIWLPVSAYQKNEDKKSFYLIRGIVCLTIAGVAYVLDVML